MKRIYAYFLMITVLILMLFTGCKKTQNIESDGLQVFVSFYPYYEIASQIGGKFVHITSMIPDGIEPHEYEPTLQQTMSLEKADVFIYNGLGMEEWTEKAVQTLPKTVKIIEASKVVPLLKMKDHEHEESDSVQQEEDEHGEYDPHLWLNPVNMKKVAEKVKDTFIQLDPTHKKDFERNYQHFAKQLDDLDTTFINTLKLTKGQEIVVSHAAFGHLTHRYNIEQHAIAGLSPHTEPSPKQIVDLQKFIKNEQLKYIYMETLASPKTAEIIAKDLGLKILVLNPIEGLTEKERQNGENYITIMKKNLKNLQKGLIQ